jgi:hypothetical protein
MEMMDLKTAIRLFDHYASMLDWQQRKALNLFCPSGLAHCCGGHPP